MVTHADNAGISSITTSPHQAAKRLLFSMYPQLRGLIYRNFSQKRVIWTHYESVWRHVVSLWGCKVREGEGGTGYIEIGRIMKNKLKCENETWWFLRVLRLREVWRSMKGKTFPSTYFTWYSTGRMMKNLLPMWTSFLFMITTDIVWLPSPLFPFLLPIPFLPLLKWTN